MAPRVRFARRADPYRDLDVIDARAPRFNQAMVGVVGFLGAITRWWFLFALERDRWEWPAPPYASVPHPMGVTELAVQLVRR